MPTNRLVIKETVDTYAQVLLDAANAAGGQEAVLEVRDQLEVVTKALRSNIDLQVALAEKAYTPEQREELVRNVFTGMHPALVDVLLVMSERDDLELANRVYAAFDGLIAARDDFEQGSPRPGQEGRAARAGGQVHPRRHHHERLWQAHRRKHRDAA